MVRTSSSNPMSIILSASSRHKYLKEEEREKYYHFEDKQVLENCDSFLPAKLNQHLQYILMFLPACI